MNKIWLAIIIISLVFGIISGNSDKMVEALFNVPYQTLNSLLKIGSMLVIYSGLFQIAIAGNVIKNISKLFNKIVDKIFKIEEEETKEFICASIVANMLGLGPANMSIALKIIERLSVLEKNKYFNLTMYLMINISSLCVLPLSTLAFRATYKASINISFIPMLFIASFLTTLLAIIIVRIGKYE